MMSSLFFFVTLSHHPLTAVDLQPKLRLSPGPKHDVKSWKQCVQNLTTLWLSLLVHRLWQCHILCPSAQILYIPELDGMLTLSHFLSQSNTKNAIVRGTALQLLVYLTWSALDSGMDSDIVGLLFCIRDGVSHSETQTWWCEGIACQCEQR